LGNYAETLLLGDFLDKKVAEHPDRTVFQSRGRITSYQELSDAVDKCAKVMLASGLCKGDCIAVLSAPRSEVFITFFAAARIGLLWLGVNPKYQIREMRHCMADAKPRMLFGIKSLDGRDYLEEVNILRDEFSYIENFVGFDGQEPYNISFDDWLNGQQCPEEDYAQAKAGVENTIDTMLIYTSGSSGTPKGVLLPQKAILKRALVEWDVFPIDPYPRVMCPLPITHVGGIIVLPLYAMVGGGTTILMETFNLDDYVQNLIDGNVNMLGAVPAMHMLMLRHPKFSFDLLDNIDWLLWSGAKMPDEAVKIFYGAGCKVGSTYGTTESSASVTFATSDKASLEIMTNTIGKSIPEGDVRIANNEDVCTVGETGELQIRPEYSLSGYLNNPEATKAAFTKDGWYRSGDLGNIREDGNIEFTSRMSEMFVSGGYNVYPLEVEQALEVHEAVVLCAVVEVPDDVYGEVGWAYIILKPGTDLTPEAIKEFAYSQMANYKVPRKFVIQPQLPMLPIGKIDKVSLKKMAQAEAGS
jgi:acyl-CoA synthetase (AMP-forming)/AMP-acid ligase II